MNVTFDFSDLNALAVEIEKAPPAVGRNVEKALGVAANKGKTVWKRAIPGRGHLKAYPHSIHYDRVKVRGAGELYTELGPDLGRAQGALGIVEDANGGVKSAPQRNYEKAQKVIAEDLVVGIEKAVGDGLGG